MPGLPELLAAAFLLLGTLLVLLSAIGLVRFPDVYCRMHAAGKAGTLGIILLVMGTAVCFAGTPDALWARGLLAILFQLVTTPAATHMLARASYMSEYPVSERTAVDELRGYLPSRADQAFNRE